MSRTSNQNPKFLREKNYQALEAHYKKYPIALYTGAGVSWSSDQKYGLRGWNDFVRDILATDERTDQATLQAFDHKVVDRWQDEPWEMAEWVARRIGPEKFEKHVSAIVQREENYEKANKLLSGKYLSTAQTLNAVTAFCGQLNGGRLVEYKSGRRQAIYVTRPNQRVRAVLTSNYDHFLEAASATMYRKPLLKPVGARGSSVGKLDQIPVFHVHGYVPFPERQGKRTPAAPIPFVDPVVTRSSYEQAWRSDDVYNFTMGPQIHVLRHYSVLFIGFSFRDAWVNNLLQELNQERKARRDRFYHYALVKEAEAQARGEGFFENLGVKPVRLGSFAEIRPLLSALYQAGLREDHDALEIQLPFTSAKGDYKTCAPITLTPDQYYNELYACRRRMVYKGKG